MSSLKTEAKIENGELIITLKANTKWLDDEFTRELKYALHHESLRLVNAWYAQKARADAERLFKESFDEGAKLAKEHLAKWEEPRIKEYAETELKRRIQEVVDESLEELRNRILQGVNSNGSC